MAGLGAKSWVKVKLAAYRVGPLSHICGLRQCQVMLSCAVVTLVITVVWVHSSPHSKHGAPGLFTLPPLRSTPVWLVKHSRAIPDATGRIGGVSLERKMRLLFLTHRYEYTSFLDRSFYFQYEAAKRHPYVEAEIWGGGLVNYSSHKTLRENLVERYGGIYFDAIFLFGHANNNELKEISDAGEAMVTIREFECFESRCKSYIDNNGVSVFQLSYMVDMHYYHEYSYNRVVMHSPHCADPSIFYISPDDAPRHGGLLIGAISSAYPLRQRWRHLIQQGRLQDAYLNQHPGYHVVSWDPQEEFRRPWSSVDDERVRARREQVLNYAKTLQGAKILLTDSSAYRYALMKFVEGIMAGCLIISDIPFDQPELFRNLVIEVSPEMTDEELAEIYHYWLHNDELREQWVHRAQQLVISKFTWDASIDRLIDSFNAYKHHEYGMYYSGAYQLRCAATNVIADKKTNEWCAKGSPS